MATYDFEPWIGLEVFAHRRMVYIIPEPPVRRLRPSDARRLAAVLTKCADEAEAQNAVVVPPVVAAAAYDCSEG